MKCIHCQTDINRKDKDHVFPKSWYPYTTDKKVQRWTIPSCIKCNRDYGKIEEEMLISIGLAIEPSHYASFGINEKAVNALDPSRAKNEKDRQMRINTREKVKSRVIKVERGFLSGVIPNLSREEDKKMVYQHGIYIPSEHFDALCKKLVKGITWLNSKKILCDNEYNFESAPIKPDKQMILLMDEQGQDFSLPPGLIIKRLADREDPNSAGYLILIWQQYLFWSSCKRKDRTIQQ